MSLIFIIVQVIYETSYKLIMYFASYCISWTKHDYLQICLKVHSESTQTLGFLCNPSHKVTWTVHDVGYGIIVILDHQNTLQNNIKAVRGNLFLLLNDRWRCISSCCSVRRFFMKQALKVIFFTCFCVAHTLADSREAIHLSFSDNLNVWSFSHPIKPKLHLVSLYSQSSQPLS